MIAAPQRSYRWYSFVTAVFVTTLLISNLIAVKLVRIAGLVLPASVILFPIAYIFGDVLTEVYGYALARRVIWTGFFCNLLAVGAVWLGGVLPAASIWSVRGFPTPAGAQQAYLAIFGFAPRLLLASFFAYLLGEFLNSYVLARLKLRTGGRFLWLRTITSTLVGEGANSLIFISIAFWGILPPVILGQTVVAQWLFKVTYEVLATPLTYLVVNTLKRSEHEDHFDRGTDFNPLSLQ